MKARAIQSPAIPETKLSRSETFEIVLEAIVTLWIVFFFYLSVILLFSAVIDFELDFLELKTLRIQFMLTEERLLTIYYLFSAVMLVISALLVLWRIRRRLRIVRLGHVFKQLEYITDGHYDYRIPDTNLGNLSSVVTSINKLVDSTVKAMED